MTATPSRLRSYADDADQHGNHFAPIAPATLRGLADEHEAMAELLAWAYRHLERRSYSVCKETEDALMMGRLKLFLEHGIEA